MYANTLLQRLCRLEEDIPLSDVQPTETPPMRAGRVYGPMTYSEYLATLPLEPHDQNDSGMMLMACGCCVRAAAVEVAAATVAVPVSIYG